MLIRTASVDHGRRAVSRGARPARTVTKVLLFGQRFPRLHDPFDILALNAGNRVTARTVPDRHVAGEIFSAFRFRECIPAVGRIRHPGATIGAVHSAVHESMVESSTGV